MSDRNNGSKTAAIGSLGTPAAVAPPSSAERIGTGPTVAASAGPFAVGSAGTSNPGASQSLAAPPQGPSLVGEVLDGRYRLIRKLGEGGMGEVYAAEHVHIEKRLAIKLLRPEIVSNQEAVNRFRQEARSASSIGHENIIAIEDFGQISDGRIYLAMELLDGQPLSDMLPSLAADPVRALAILIQTGHGLAAAHAKGIIHRDMKPENVFVTRLSDGRDVPKLLDFGIAKVSGNDGSNNLTRTGTIFGTPYYMAPEQALGQQVDGRTDVYAMGVILYEVFAGSLPFGGESFMGVLTQHITAMPEPIAQRAASAGRMLLPGIADIVAKAMHKEPAQRFATMNDMVAAMVAVYRNVSGPGMSAHIMSAQGMAGASLQGAPGAAAMSGALGLQPMSVAAVAAPAARDPRAAGFAPALSQQQAPTGPSAASANYVAADDDVFSPKPRRRSSAWVVVALLVIAAGTGVWYTQFGPGATESTSAVAAIEPAPVDKVVVDKPPVVAPPVTPPTVPVVTPPVEDVTPIEDIKPTVPPMLISVKPVGVTADVMSADGETLLGQTPFDAPVRAEAYSVILRADGYKDADVVVREGMAKKSVKLVKQKRAGGGPVIKPPRVDPNSQNSVKPPPELTAAEKRRQICEKNPSDSRCDLE
ncbi:MAG: serine/threonine protein kinase [Myxococcales bacterium]|nr:serine/threonine protein kinase [Myxococcales bacterium]